MLLAVHPLSTVIHMHSHVHAHTKIDFEYMELAGAAFTSVSLLLW